MKLLLRSGEFSIRRVLKALAVVLLVALPIDLLVGGAGVSSAIVNILLFVVLGPWLLFYPLLGFGFLSEIGFVAFFLTYAISRLNRHSDFSKRLSACLPVVGSLYLAYMATGFSQAFTKPYLWTEPPIRPGEPGLVLDAGGFPLKYHFYSPEHSGFFGSSVTPEIKAVPLVINLAFYLVLFLVVWIRLRRWNSGRKKAVAVAAGQ